MKVLAGKAGNEVGLADEILLNLASIICLNKALHTDLFSKCQCSEALCGTHVSPMDVRTPERTNPWIYERLNVRNPGCKNTYMSRLVYNCIF